MNKHKEEKISPIYVHIMPPLKALLLIVLCYYYSFLIVIPTYYFGINLYYYLVNKFYGLISLTTGDKFFLDLNLKEPYNGITFMETTRGKQKVLLDVFYKKALKNIPKTRAVLTFWGIDYFWKPLSYEEAIKKLKVYENSAIIKTKKDMCEFSNKLLKESIDIYSSQLPYEVYIFDHPDSIPLIAFKFHHGMSDGIGFVSLFFGMSNNYSLKIFPFTIKEPSIIMIALLYLKLLFTFPVTFLKIFLNGLVYSDCGPSPFKYINNNKKNGGYCDKIIEKDAQNGTLFSISKSWLFSDFSKIKNYQNITFNDLMVSIVSAATKKFFKNRNINKDKIGLLCPISLRGFPIKFEDTKLMNEVYGSSLDIPLIDNVVTDAPKVSKKLSTVFRNFGYIKLGNILNTLFNTFLPKFAIRLMYRLSIRKADLLISNIPGPKNSLHFDDCELTNIYPFITTGLHSSFMTILSYNNYFIIQFNCNEGVDLNPWEFMEFLEAELEFTLETYKKIIN